MTLRKWGGAVLGNKKDVGKIQFCCFKVTDNILHGLPEVKKKKKLMLERSFDMLIKVEVSKGKYKLKYLVAFPA